jgi:hypothetical protein
LTASAPTSGNVIPSLLDTQVSPLSLERYTPPPSPNCDNVPAKT